MVKRWLRAMSSHPLLAGGAVLVLEGLVEYILSWGSVWRPVVTGGVVTMFFFLLKRGGLASEETFDKHQRPRDEAVHADDDEGPPRVPESTESIAQAIHEGSFPKEINKSSLPFISRIVLFMKDRPRAEMATLSERYKGRRVSVEGEIRRIGAPFGTISHDYMNVYLHIPHPDLDPDYGLPLDVTCTFDAKKWLDELISYAKGDTIRIVGAIEMVRYYTIDLDDCELDRSDPQEKPS